MAEAAEMDLALPYSLTCDAWDIAYEAGCVRPNYGEWAACLLDALDAYEADQLGYWTKERIARARGEN